MLNIFIPYFTINSLSYGGCLEILLLSFALARRIQVLREERERFQIQTIKDEYHIQNLKIKNQILEKDLDLAREVQKRLIPDVSHLPGFNSIYMPMEKVGGDFFDILDLGPNKKGILFCDVTGHGVSAAFITALIKSTVSNELKNYHAGLMNSSWLDSPKETLNNLNYILAGYSNKHYLSAIYGIMDLKSKTFNFLSASHPPIICLKESGNQAELEFISPTPQLPFLGAWPDDKFRKFISRTASVHCASRSRIIMISDGFFETIDFNYEIYERGMESFLNTPVYDLFLNSFKYSPNEFNKSLKNILKIRLKSSPPVDDICILTID